MKRKIGCSVGVLLMVWGASGCGGADSGDKVGSSADVLSGDTSRQGESAICSSEHSCQGEREKKEVQGGSAPVRKQKQEKPLTDAEKKERDRLQALERKKNQALFDRCIGITSRQACDAISGCRARELKRAVYDTQAKSCSEVGKRFLCLVLQEVSSSAMHYFGRDLGGGKWEVFEASSIVSPLGEPFVDSLSDQLDDEAYRCVQGS